MTGCFGNSCRYSVVQSHWGAAVPPLSGRQSFGNSWGFPWPLHATVACLSGRVGCGVVTSRHRRCAQDIAARMWWTSIRDTEDKRPDVSSRPKVTRRSVHPHHSEANTIQALMDLALPRFEGLHRPWMVSTESPASPDPGGFNGTPAVIVSMFEPRCVVVGRHRGFYWFRGLCWFGYSIVRFG